MNIIKTLSRVKAADANASASKADALADLKAEQEESAFLSLQLRQAMHKCQLKLDYQVKLSMPGSHIQQLSAHLVWQQGKRLITHLELQAMAHRAGHVQTLCNYLLIQLSHDLAQLRFLGLAIKPVSLQLSPQLLSLSAYMADFKLYLQELGLSADDVVLEFPLAQALRQDDTVQASLQSLKEQGLNYVLHAPDFSGNSLDADLSAGLANLPRGLYLLQDLTLEDVCRFAYEEQQALA